MYSSAAGSRIVANGLAAFWAFQAWGNNSKVFDEDDFISSLENHLGNKSGKTAADEFNDTLLNFKDWSFAVPTHPKIFFLDTRTQRGPSATKWDVLNGEKHYRPPLFSPWIPPGLLNSDIAIQEFPPRLLNRQARTDIERKMQNTSQTDPLIVVSPAPILGSEVIDYLQKIISRYVGPEPYDLEAWSANPNNLIDFFSLVSSLGHRTNIVLSGDVHYTFGVKGVLQHQGSQQTILQFTSSASKNSWPFALGNFVFEDVSSNWWWQGKDYGSVDIVDSGSLGLEELVVKRREQQIGRLPDYKTNIKYMKHRHYKTLEVRNNIGLLTIWGPNSGRNQIFIVNKEGKIDILAHWQWP